MADELLSNNTVYSSGVAEPVKWNNDPTAMDGNVSLTSGEVSASALKDQVMQQGNALLNQTKDVAGQALENAKNQVKTQASAQKERAVNRLDSATSALEGTGKQFRDQDLAMVAGYVDNVTGQVRHVTQYLRENDIDGLVQDVEAFARHNPAVFISGAFLLGIAAARFLKSSANSANATSTQGLTMNRSDNLPARLSNSTSFISREPIQDSAEVFGNRPLSAHNYVLGLGINGQENNGLE
jgi:hypothetical protein